ncbi:aminopeptidase [Mucilaginibacter robiniae]|uniref:Aminopeptidase N n=2 Tax=Mucilaginibacter robiniae TaxID=2728022 RepID=A0A7L5EBT4_9SPHI|nr:aminopeptidase [Mucilaginibacter robiniae]
MKSTVKTFFQTLLFIGLSSLSHAQQIGKFVTVEPGVSYPLAVYRHSVISDIQYTLDFIIPAEKSQAIAATESISFNAKPFNQPLQLDFKQSPDYVKNVTVNGKSVPVELQAEHLLIRQQYLHAGQNQIAIQFTAGNASLNRNDDYLYALFVPDRARTVFPCFDQPDLKARFLLTLRVPTGWRVLANGTKKDSVTQGAQTVYHFNNSDKLSTYLFSFTAGKYSDVAQTIGHRQAEFLYRENDPKKIKLSVDSVFKAHQDAIAFLEQWTNIPFPFQKVGFVAIPDFQFGGMEHPGEVQYQSSSLFLDDGATKDRLIARSNLISHETAHMWFGDLVTMQWFNDVWMKEVFANFMADKITEKLMGTETFNLKFLQDHYPTAYGVDRTEGANPIRQQLDNLQDAGSLYGNIIYHKAPIMMRQLERLMGKDNFQQGIQEYLKKYAYQNATWNDLITILNRHSQTDLYEWNRVWVNQPGRPVFDYDFIYAGDKISRLTITQHPETGQPRIWPQAFTVTLFYADHHQTIPVNMTGAQVSLTTASGMAKPNFILFNSDGMGYGLFPTDKNIISQLYGLPNPLQRATAYIAAYENMLAGRYFKPTELLTLFTQGITQEKDEMNLRLLTGYLGTIYWEFIRPADRQAQLVKLEHALWSAMQQQTAANNKKILFGAYQNVFVSVEARQNLYNIWQHQQAPEGVKLAEDDYTSLALSLALKSDTVTHILQRQENRITNQDRKKRLAFLMPALSLNVQERDAFFESLKQRQNRAKEAWVVAALGYLHHPLRQSTSEKYLPESLNLLEEIQRTGDVFFPQSWLGAIFSNYQDQQAAQVVRSFLQTHPDYNPKLRDKLLQAADNLFRAQKLLNN